MPGIRTFCRVVALFVAMSIATATGQAVPQADGVDSGGGACLQKKQTRR